MLGRFQSTIPDFLYSEVFRVPQQFQDSKERPLPALSTVLMYIKFQCRERVTPCFVCLSLSLFLYRLLCVSSLSLSPLWRLRVRVESLMKGGETRGEESKGM